MSGSKAALALACAGVGFLVVAVLCSALPASGVASEARRVECMRRCEPHPVEQHWTKADGSLGCICDETRAIR